MSILIKGMDMPKTAFECSTKINPEERRCNYTGKVFEETLSLITQRRCDNCPLVEVPTPHGDLIDRTNLEADYVLEDDKNPLTIMEEAPTIIEAEE